MFNQPAVIDRILDEFDKAWADGEQPDWKTFTRPEQSVDPELAWEIIQRDLYWRLCRRIDVDAGEPVVERYLRHPELALPEERRRALIALEAEWRKDLVEQRATPVPADATEIAAGPIGDVSDLDHLEEFGRGGMGIVYRSADPELQRDVALKVLRPELHPQAAARFLREAQILAQLEHPGIVPIHELGYLPDGRPYFTMKVVRGDTLAKLLEQRPAPGENLPRFLAVFEQICQTLAYAHTKKVTHRDLKPANVMVGAFGEIQLMDWGLAGRLNSDEQPPCVADAADPERATRYGFALGTYPFMAPEQARGLLDRIDERTDVFGLGGILCEILTGAPPYREPNIQRKAETADLEDAWQRLAYCGADPALIQIARDCLAAATQDRPANAGAVADRIGEYRTEQTKRIEQAKLAQAKAEEAQARLAAEQKALAAEVSRIRARRWAYALVVGLIGLAVVMALVMEVPTVVKGVVQGEEFYQGRPAHYWARKLDAPGDLRQSGAFPVLAQIIRTPKRYTNLERRNAIKFLAQMEWPPDDVTILLGKLLEDQDAEVRRAARNALGSGKLKNFEAALPYLYRLLNRPDLGEQTSEREECIPVIERLNGCFKPIEGVHWENVCDGREGRERCKWRYFAFSPDSKELRAITDTDIRVWPVASANLRVSKRPGLPQQVTGALNPDGSQAILVEGWRPPVLWDVKDSKELPGPAGLVNARVRHAAYSPDGRFLALVTDSKLIMYDVGATPFKELRHIQPFMSDQTFYHQVIFSPDSGLLAVYALGAMPGDPQSEVAWWLFDMKSGRLKRRFPAFRRLLPLWNDQREIAEFSPDGKCFAAWALRSWPKTVLRDKKDGPGKKFLEEVPVRFGLFVWDVATGKQVAKLDGFGGSSLSSLVFIGNCPTLALAQGKQIYLWDIPTGRKLRELPWHHHPIDALAVSPDRRWLASADQKGWVKLWDLSGILQR